MQQKIISPRLMGIVNVTPDSFSDGGRFNKVSLAVDHAMALVAEGAHILDIGGESTRPCADFVSEDEELERVVPVIEMLRTRTDCAISIDTRKPGVAVAAVDAGASIWNDVSALTYSPQSLNIASRLSCDIVLMHAQGSPETMQDDPNYEDVVADIMGWLEARIQACLLAGISRDRLIIDPGIGFGKTLSHNLDLIADLEAFQSLGVPLLFGASRKSFIAALDRDGPADQRLGGSIAAAILAAQKRAHILRVHDVAQTRSAISVLSGVHAHKNRQGHP